MTDADAIQIAKRVGLPVVLIPPRGAVNETITVDLRDRDRPVVTRKSNA